MVMLAVVLVMVAMLVTSAGTALGIPPLAACNQGTEMAHDTIPKGVPSHEHVPEDCE